MKAKPGPEKPLKQKREKKQKRTRIHQLKSDRIKIYYRHHDHRHLKEEAPSTSLERVSCFYINQQDDEGSLVALSFTHSQVNEMR